MVVREAEAGDAAAIAAIGSVAFPKTYEGFVPEEVIRSVVEQTYSIPALERCIGACAAASDAHFLVAERGHDVIGYLHFDSAGPEPELHRIYVDPEATGGGIGQALLDELHRRLPEGASYILMVMATNEQAIRFYARNGFTVAREVDGIDYYEEHMGVTFAPGSRSVPCLVMARST